MSDIQLFLVIFIGVGAIAALAIFLQTAFLAKQGFRETLHDLWFTYVGDDEAQKSKQATETDDLSNNQ